MSEKIKLNRPDVSFANRIKAIFYDDPEIIIEYFDSKDSEPGTLVLKVINNPVKMDAIRKILPETYEIGKTILKVVVKSADEGGKVNEAVIRAAFDKNPHFKDFISITDPFTGMEYPIVVFNKEVIQFPNDNGGSLHGFEFRLMEDLAQEVFDIPRLIYTTDDGLPIETNSVLENNR